MPIGTGVDSGMVVLVNTLNATLKKNVEPTIYDQVLKGNPVLYRFWKKGPVISGGASLIWPALTNVKKYGGWYTGAGQLAHGVEDTIQPAEVQWRHLYEDVTIPRTDIAKASGVEAVVDLVKTKFDEATMVCRSRLSQALWVQGGSLALDNFAQAIDDGNAYASYAGISHTATNTDGNYFWKPGIAGDAIVTTSTPVTLTKIQEIYGNASDGDTQPTLIVTTQTGYNYIWGQLQAQQRYVSDDEMTKTGFEALKFNRAVVVVDRNVPSGAIYFLNEDWISLVSLKGDNFTIDPIITGSPSERSINTKIIWSGNLKVKTPRFQGKIINATNV